MTTLQKLLFFIFAIGWSVNSICQQKQLHRYTPENGLPQNTVYHINQDNKGFLWLATPDGLARFDGQNFKTWRADFKDTNALKSSSITAVLQDKSDNIWVCTATGGLSKYNAKTSEWRTYLLRDSKNSPYSNSAYKPIIIGDTALWYLAGWSLQKVIINREEPIFEHFILETEHEARDRYVLRDFDFDGDKTLWVASPIGMVRFNLETEQYQLELNQEKYHLDSAILACEFDDRGDLWFSPFTKPSRIIRKENLESAIYSTINPYVPGEIGIPVIKFKKMNNGQMFAMGSFGLYACNYQDKQADFYPYSPNNHLLKHLVWDATFDWANNLWIGTESGLYADFATQGVFRTIQNRQLKGELANATYRILKVDNKVFYGSRNQVNILDVTTQNFSSININFDSDQKSALISDIRADKNQNVWIATYPYLVRIDAKTNSITKTKIKIDVPGQSFSITSFFIDAAGKFWFGHINGLTRYDPTTEQWKSYLHNERDYFTSIADFDEKHIIGGCGGFLYLIDKVTLQSRKIFWSDHTGETDTEYLNRHKMLLVSGAYVFVGAKNGFFSYHVETKTWQHYTVENGLPSNVIRALAVDDQNRIWMSTNHGIACFNSETKRINTFNPSDILACLEFNSRAVEKDENGIIYFGCDEGVLQINPNEFETNKVIPPVVFTKLAVFNKEVLPNSMANQPELPSLSRTLAYSDAITLKHSHSVFTVDFIALNFIEPEHVQYRHRLVGFEEDWLFDGSKHALTYTNLDPGSYTLEVQATNDAGLWGEEVYSLQIDILPPWYTTIWMKLTSITFLGLLLYGLYLWRIRVLKQKERVKFQIQQAHLQAREDFRRESAADFHDEAGNKITRINLLTELASGEVTNNPILVGYIDGIEQNIKALSAGMRDFLWVMDPDKDTLFDTIYRLQRFGDSMFNGTSCEFTIEGLEQRLQHIKLGMQERKAIVQIFKEGIHNCLKHASASKVTLTVNVKERELHITLIDNGIGFNTKFQTEPNHYGINIMQKRAENVGATFTLKSTKGTGCAIEVNKPLPQMG